MTQEAREINISIFRFVKDKMIISDGYNGTPSGFENVPIEKSLDANLENIKRILGNTADLLISPITVSGVRAAVICFEGMVSGFNTAQVVVKPLMRVDIPDCTSEKLYSHVKENMILSVDTTETDKYGDVIRTVMSGFVILLIDNIPSAMCFGIQGYSVRGIDEPSSEGNIMGSHEGFVETVRTNMSLVRRRIKSPVLQFRLFPRCTYFEFQYNVLRYEPE